MESLQSMTKEKYFCTERNSSFRSHCLGICRPSIVMYLIFLSLTSVKLIQVYIVKINKPVQGWFYPGCWRPTLQADWLPAFHLMSLLLIGWLQRWLTVGTRSFLKKREAKFADVNERKRKVTKVFESIKSSLYLIVPCKKCRSRLLNSKCWTRLTTLLSDIEQCYPRITQVQQV